MIRRVALAAAMLATSLAVTGCVGCPQARATGVVVEDGDRLGLHHPGGGILHVEWPVGHRTERHGDQLVLVDLFGIVRARPGDTIQVSGGTPPGEDVFEACGEVTRVDAAPTPQEA